MFGNDNRQDMSDVIFFTAMIGLFTAFCSLIGRIFWPLLMKTLRAAGNAIGYVVGRLIR